MDDDGVSTDRFRFCAFLWDDILLYIGRSSRCGGGEVWGIFVF